MKKYLCFTMILVLLLVQSVFTVNADPQVTITVQIGNEIMTVNGNTQEVDPGRGTVPVILEARTLLPIRVMIESLGGEVGWVDAEKRVTIEMAGNLIELSMLNPEYKEALVFMGVGKPYETIGFHEGSKEMTVNSETITNDVPAIIINSRTYMPLRFISENVGCEVAWEDATKTVTVTYGEPPQTTTPVDTPTPGETPADTPTPGETPEDTPTPGETPADTPTPGETPADTPTPGETPADTPTPTPVVEDPNYQGSWAQVPVIIERVNPPEFPAADFNVMDYGAVNDPAVDSKDAINDAIKACNAAGGGRVVVPAGSYLSNGPINLEDNVNLHLEEGSTITFGSNTADFLPVVEVRWECTVIMNYSPLVYTYKKKNVAITGNGVLDGQGKEVWIPWKQLDDPDKDLNRQMNNDGATVQEMTFGEGHYLRPNMVVFYECENILVEGIKIRDASMWCLHPTFCKNVTIRSMTFDSKNVSANNDGIDVDSCVDVHIHDVVFGNGDDNIPIKSGRDLQGRELNRPSKNVVIQNCTFNNYTAVAMGSEMSGGVYNIFIENCTADTELKRAFYIKGNVDRGGEVSHIRFRNIDFLSTYKQMFSISTDYGSDGFSNLPPYFHDIWAENINATGPCSIGLHISGKPEKPVENIVFKDVVVDQAETVQEISNADKLYFQNVTIAGESLDNATNLPPDVFAGPEATISAGGTVNIGGSVADDATPAEQMTYSWSVLEGNSGAVTFADASAFKTTATISTAGTYKLKVVANDGELDGYHFVTITVN